MLAGIALQVARRGQPFAAPCALLSGGDTTVTVRGTGRGGRNVEALLSCALTLGDHPRIHALMEDTDGVDGLEEIVGAHATPDTLAGARALGIKPRERLDANDCRGSFGALGDALVTGPTRTNVNDFRAIVVGVLARAHGARAHPQIDGSGATAHGAVALPYRRRMPCGVRCALRGGPSGDWPAPRGRRWRCSL